VLAGVGDGDADPALRAALAAATSVAAPRALLAAHRGLVPPGAVVEVLPDAALDDPGGLRIDLPEQGGDLLVLFPAGRALTTLAAALTADLGADRVTLLPPPPAAPVDEDPDAGDVGRLPADLVADGEQVGGAGDAGRPSADLVAAGEQVGGDAGRTPAGAPAAGEQVGEGAGPAGGVGGASVGGVAAGDLAAEGLRRVRASVDLGRFGPLGRAVVERVVLVSGDERWADDLVLDEDVLAAAAAALRRGAPVVVDVEALAAALPQVEALCGLRDDLVTLFAQRERTTRVAAGLRLAVRAAGRGAVCVVGRDPAALAALLDLDADPALVLGLPGGWAGAVEAKRAVRDAGLPALTNRSRRGGSDVAAAALEALLDHG